MDNHQRICTSAGLRQTWTEQNKTIRRVPISTAAANIKKSWWQWFKELSWWITTKEFSLARLHYCKRKKNCATNIIFSILPSKDRIGLLMKHKKKVSSILHKDMGSFLRTHTYSNISAMELTSFNWSNRSSRVLLQHIDSEISYEVRFVEA